MKKISLSITCLLFFAATGFSQNNLKTTSLLGQPVPHQIISENLISGLMSDGKPEERAEINMILIVQPTDKLCFPRKIFNNKK